MSHGRLQCRYRHIQVKFLSCLQNVVDACLGLDSGAQEEAVCQCTIHILKQEFEDRDLTERERFVQHPVLVLSGIGTHCLCVALKSQQHAQPPDYCRTRLKYQRCLGARSYFR
jgi:hypothetical protein